MVSVAPVSPISTAEYKNNKFENLNIEYCPICNNKLEYDFYHFESNGEYKCSKCKFKKPKIKLIKSKLKNFLIWGIGLWGIDYWASKATSIIGKFPNANFRVLEISIYTQSVAQNFSIKNIEFSKVKVKQV